ncbi:DNA circularization protein [Nissabacter sp. SGAir0207]|uniref:DNA circularization protein n=1 Tax=Nissabacter sp. SGAir0207 TaxID=2126321 RepID=UPI0010CD1169|nr:DNA circularization N-terminal domain-containing protein [Nissabacter sp. SGAir0207]QCR38942.1 hypothetical protein C1N62_22770 [Nissabacter sp. SGAir0207]
MTIVHDAISGLLGTSGDTWDWQSNLHAASFRGVPFAVEKGDAKFGRRLAVHEYPYRDSVWVEDMGRSTRRFTITGFIIQSSLVYTAPDVMTQRNSLIAAAETAGAGTLVHPTLGELTVSIPEGGLTISESLEEGRIFRFTLNAVESGLKVFAITSSADAASTVKTSWLSTITTTAAKFIAEVKGDLRALSSAITTLKSTAAFWVGMVTDTVSQATNLANVLKSTFGTTRYGRYNTGSVGGNAAGATTANDDTADTGDYDGLVTSKLAASIQNKAAIDKALAAIGEVGSVEGFAKAIQTVFDELLGLTAGGMDLIGLLEALSAFEDSTVYADKAATQITLAARIYLNSLSASAMAYAASQYTPANYEEAMDLTRRVVDVLDSVALLAADNAYDDLYSQLQMLRENIVTTLGNNGADLARVQTVTFALPLPALTIANRLYQDASRTEAVVKMADPIHPAFMPTSFKALTS